MEAPALFASFVIARRTAGRAKRATPLPAAKSSRAHCNNKSHTSIVGGIARIRTATIHTRVRYLFGLGLAVRSSSQYQTASKCGRDQYIHPHCER